MAYETPPTQSSGHVITAAEWNQLVNDIIETAVAKILAKGDLVAGTGANTLARIAVGANGAYLIANSTNSNGIGWETPQYCKLRRTTNVTITSGTLTAIIFDGTMEESDASSLHDGVTNNTRITSAVAGKYLVGGQVQFQSHAGGTYRLASIHKNGTEIAKQEAEHVGAGPTPTCNLAMMVPLGVGDWVEIRAEHNAGTGINVQDAILWAQLISTY